jgi:hypothetical protein
LSQILNTNRHSQSLIDMFTLAMDNHTDGQRTASRSHLRDIFCLCWANIGNYYIILDGLDECTISFDHLLESVLEKSSESSNIKILLFSRPAGPSVEWISQAVPVERRFDIGNSTTNDIQLYLSRQITSIVNKNLLSKNVNSEQLVSHLVTGANGMFLWASLMCRHLSSRMFSPTQRAHLIMTVTLPEDLGSMYDRICNFILERPVLEVDLAKSVLKWLTFGHINLNARQLWQAVSINDIKTSENPVTDDLGNFRDTVLLVCASLVEFRASPENSEDASFRLAHLSLKEHILQCANELDKSYGQKALRAFPLQFRKSECHAEITRSCLHFLTYCLPPQPLGGAIGKDVTSSDLSKAFPFSKYAAQNWPIHLSRTFENEDIILDENGEQNYTQDTSRLEILRPTLVAFQDYISRKFALMAWIEASYVFGAAGLVANFGHWLLSNSNTSYGCDLQQIGSDYLEFSEYLKDLHMQWGQQLKEHPGCIWEEVTAFKPSRLLAQTTAFRVNSLVGSRVKDEKSSSQPLCKISGVSSDGLYVGVLSIWPSRYGNFRSTHNI